MNALDGLNARTDALIDGALLPVADGRTFDSISPRDGAAIADARSVDVPGASKTTWISLA